MCSMTLTFRRKAPLSPRFPQVALGVKNAVAVPLPLGVVTVLKVDGTELVALALLVGDSVVELAGAAESVAGPCEAVGVGGAVMEVPLWLASAEDDEFVAGVADDWLGAD